MKLNIKIFWISLIVTSFSSYGQQDPMVSQYMFNGLYLNPAYAGSHEYWSSSITYRSQWAGAQFKGAPQTSIASIDGPIRGKNMGLGVTFLNDRIGTSSQNMLQASYGYQLKLKKDSRLAFGLSIGVSSFSANLQEVLIWDEDDQVYAQNRSIIVPRSGVGAYYFSKKFYAGVSIPTLIAFQDGNNFSVDLSQASFLRRHYLFTSGIVLNAGDNVKLKPSVLLKYVKGAPLQGDLNFAMVIKDQFWIGAGYRTGDAALLTLEYQSKSYFRIGYAYDITVSGLRSYQNGSHEIMIGIDFGKDLKKIKSPRYF